MVDIPGRPCRREPVADEPLRTPEVCL